MTFLNPLVLFGLITAAIPVILHLLNLRKLRTIEFSTLTFLKELQQTKIRRLKLRQILLLIIRTLLVIFIVLAFSRPALRGTILGSLGSQAHSTIVFILDDSFSMTGNDEHGEYFKQAKETADKLIDLLKEGDEAFLIKLSDVPQATIDPATHDFAALRTIFHESQISAIRRPLEDAIGLSAKLLQQSKNANKEVYIISDLQQTLLSQRSVGIPENNPSLFDDHSHFFFVPIGVKEIANVSIDSIDITTTILEKDKPISVIASIGNFGITPLNNYIISAYIDGIKMAQKNLAIEPWGYAKTEFSISSKRTGFIRGYLELENDAIELDNRRYFTFYIPEQINIAVIANAEMDKRLLLFALRSGETKSGQSLLNIQQYTLQKFPFIDLNKTDVLVLSNIPSFSSTDANRIKNFIEEGGGIVLFPGDNISIENYNSNLLPALKIPPIDYSPTASVQADNLSFQKIDLAHPLFSTVFEQDRSAKEQTGIESPNIIKSIKRHAGKQSRVIISLSDGTPFLSEYNIGEGKFLFFSSAPLLSWSDFPLKGIFAPLIYRSMIFVSSTEEKNNSYITGESPAITLRKSLAGNMNRQFSITSPEGIEELIHPANSIVNERATTKPMIFTPSRLTNSGFYEVKQNSSMISLIGVNTDRLESDTRKISQIDLLNEMKRYGISAGKIHFSKPGESLQSEILQSRFGVELWQYCIGLALILAIIEMLIARDSRKATKDSL